MMRFFSKFFLFLIVSVFVCSCSGDSSSSSKVNGPDAGDSSSSEELSSGAVVDTVVEYVEPPTLSCELVEGLQFEFSPKPDTSYFIKSFGFYGDDLIAIPRHYNMRGFYGHEDDPAIDTFYVKKNGSSLWQKYSAFEHYWYKQEGNKLCIVGNKLALVRSDGSGDDSNREICHSYDARNWVCDSVHGEIFLTCDDKYFYKSENDKLYYSEDASVWNPIAFDFADGIHSINDAISNDSAHFVLVGYWNPIRNNAGETVDVSWRTALLHSRDMVTWDTTYMMENVGWSLAHIGDVYVSNVGWGGSGYLYYSKDLRNWTQTSLKSNEVIYGSMAVSNGVLVVVGAYGHVYASKNGRDFKLQETCGSKEDYVSVIADSKGNFYALRGERFGGLYSGKYVILRIVE